MDWRDDAIVLGLKAFGENGAILEALTRAHGRHLGLVRGATSKRLKGALEPGNVLRVHWRARLDEQLGAYTVEPEQARAQLFFYDGLKLAGLAASCAICAASLPERENHARVFDALNALLEAMAARASPAWLEDYVRFEIGLLEDLGFWFRPHGVRGDRRARHARLRFAEDRPRGQRAAGAPYRDKLLSLPKFLTPEEGAPEIKDLVDGMALTRFFLERMALEHGAVLPQARDRLSERLAALAAAR